MAQTEADGRDPADGLLHEFDKQQPRQLLNRTKMETWMTGSGGRPPTTIGRRRTGHAFADELVLIMNTQVKKTHALDLADAEEDRGDELEARTYGDGQCRKLETGTCGHRRGRTGRAAGLGRTRRVRERMRCRCRGATAGEERRNPTLAAAHGPGRRRGDANLATRARKRARGS